MALAIRKQTLPDSFRCHLEDLATRDDTVRDVGVRYEGLAREISTRLKVFHQTDLGANQKLSGWETTQRKTVSVWFRSGQGNLSSTLGITQRSKVRLPCDWVKASQSASRADGAPSGKFVHGYVHRNGNVCSKDFLGERFECRVSNYPQPKNAGLVFA